MLRTVRIILWLTVAVAVAVGAWLALRQSPTTGPISQPMATIGGPFTLTDADGKPFSSSRLGGKPYAIFFGFTHCPDVCPTTLSRLVKLRAQAGKGDDALAIVFVSVDPERDTSAEMKRYAELFNAPMVALTGSPATVDQVKRAFGIYSAKVPRDGGGYDVEHTATVFLMDRAGKFRATIAPDEADSVALQKIRSLIS